MPIGVEGIPRRFLLTEERKTVFEPPGSYEYDTSNAEPLEVPAGTLVVLHGSFVHFSHVNKSDRSRQVSIFNGYLSHTLIPLVPVVLLCEGKTYSRISLHSILNLK